MMGIAWTLLMFLVIIQVPTICWTGRANILNVSKESQSDPLLIWLVQTAKHGTSDANKRYAVLHSVTLGTGPTTNSGTLDSFVFGGTSDSYVELNNMDGELNGHDAMCWAFYVKFPSGAPEAVLLQYFGRDGTEGLQLILRTDGTLRAEFYDEVGQKYTITSEFELESDTWYLVGMNFNTLWDDDDQFDIFYFESSNKVESETIGLGRSNPFLDSEGTVRLGAARDGTSPFNGEISCVQFYNTSLIGGTQKSIYNLCDPNFMASDYGEHTMDFVATTTATMTTMPTTTTTMPTTMTTTEATSPTTSPSTTTPPTTPQTTLTTTTPTTTPQTTLTTTTTPTTTPQTTLTTTTTPTTIPRTTLTTTTTPTTTPQTTSPSTTTPTTTPQTTLTTTTTPTTTTPQTTLTTMTTPTTTTPQTTLTTTTTPTTTPQTTLTTTTTPTTTSQTTSPSTTPTTTPQTTSPSMTTPTTTPQTTSPSTTTPTTTPQTTLTTTTTPPTTSTTPTTTSTTPPTTSTTPPTTSTTPTTTSTTPPTTSTTPPTTSTTPTTTSTTPTTTSTTPPTTSTTPSITTIMTSTTTTFPSTASTTPPATIPTLPTTSQPSAQLFSGENCLMFTRSSVDETFQSPLETIVATSSSECALLCYKNDDCRSISIKGSTPSITCVLGMDNALTQLDTGAVIFDMS